MLVGSLAAHPPGLQLALELEIERHCSADQILQGRLIDLLAFVDVDGAPDISSRPELNIEIEAPRPRVDDFALPPWDYDVASTTQQPFIRNNRETGERELVSLRWGLIPFFTNESC